MKVEISLDAIKRNAERLTLACKKPLIPMVKADAYGHGALAVVRALPASCYGVATEEEGIPLRMLEKQVLVTAPSLSGMGAVRRYDMIPLIGEADLVKAAVACGIKRCHIKVNSGMNRLGFRGERECYQAAKMLLKGGVAVEGIATHYARDSDTSVKEQNAAFDKAVLAVKKAAADIGKVQPIFTHVTGSGALYAQNYDRLRVGLALYGYHSGYYTAGLPLEQAMRVTSQVIKVKSIAKGTRLGYSGIYRAKKRMKAYTVLGGYGDGISRSEVGRSVIAAGRRLTIAAVCMDTFEMVSPDVDLSVGDRVIILSGALGADSIASYRGTIPYEVLLGYNVPRAERIYDG